MSNMALRKIRWIICIDGTYGDRNSNLQRASTVVADLADLLSQHQHGTYIWYLEGLGTSGTIVDRVLGGFTGLGVDNQIRKAYHFLTENWKEEHEIVIVGYSRGAHAAIRLAELISSVGLPRENRSGGARELYKRFERGELDRDESRWRSIREFKCHEAVPIKALALFDTVSTLGIPKTGILRFLNWVPNPSDKKKGLPAINTLQQVENIFHAVACHETRGPYTPALVHLPPESKTKLEQVWFNGTHRDLGKERHHGGGGLIDIPLAWMIDQLTSVGVQFPQAGLERRFPGYHRTDATNNAEEAPPKHLKEWAAGNANRTYRGLMTLMGYEARRPGRYALSIPPGIGASCASRTNEQIHISVRLRGHGITERSPSLPGLRYIHSVDKSVKWTSCGSWSTEGDERDQIVIDEAPFGALEAELHNIPLP